MSRIIGIAAARVAPVPNDPEGTRATTFGGGVRTRAASMPALAGALANQVRAVNPRIRSLFGTGRSVVAGMRRLGPLHGPIGAAKAR